MCLGQTDLEELVSFAQGIVANPPKHTVYCNLGPHIIQEINSHNCLGMKNIVKYYSPCFDKNGQMIAGLAIESPELINIAEIDRQTHTDPELNYPDNVIQLDFGS